jgi:hypothetical protein
VGCQLFGIGFSKMETTGGGFRGKVTAKAAADSTKSGSATVSAETPTGLGTSQITVTATAAGGTAHGDLVTLIVQ